MTHPTDTQFIKDADLHAYLDGELAVADEPSVQARLKVDTDARILVMSLTVQREALQTKYPLPDDCPKTKALIEAVLNGRM